MAQFIFNLILRWLNSLLPQDPPSQTMEHFPDGHPDTTPVPVKPKANPPKTSVLLPGGDDILKGIFKSKK